MRNLSDNDKKIWKFYTSNLNSIKRIKKDKEPFFKNVAIINKDLKPSKYFQLDNKTKKQLNNKNPTFDAIVDLHGKTEFQAYEIVKDFIKKCYSNEFKSIIIITGKGINNQGKLKLKTPLWLKTPELSKFVVGFETMPHNKGGEGALFVKLKNIKKYK
jgi:DNA-nicking Smr family endonuclease